MVDSDPEAVFGGRSKSVQKGETTINTKTIQMRADKPISKSRQKVDPIKMKESRSKFYEDAEKKY